MRTLRNLKTRKLSLETLENRELLSVNPLLPLSGIESPVVQAASFEPQAAAVPDGYNAHDWNLVESQGLKDYATWDNGKEARLIRIDADGKGLAASLNLSGCTNLEYLYCSDNDLTSLNVSGCTNLYQLYCSGNDLTSLNVSGCTNLYRLHCVDNQLSTLDVSGCTDLYWLDCKTNQLTSLNVSGLMNLKILYCEYNQLNSLDVFKNTNLITLYCTGNNLTSLNISGLTNLESLSCNTNQLTSLNVSGFTNLESLSCWGNQLTSLNVSELMNLKILHCFNNQLTSLNVSGLTNLEYLWCASNQLISLNVSGLTNLEYLLCDSNQLTLLNVSGLTNLKELWCDDNKLTFATLPIDNFVAFYYNNQAEVPIGNDDDSIPQTNFSGLQSQYNAGGGTTTYTWYHEGGTAVDSNLITNINGVFTFDESLNGERIYCKMTNTAFPDLTLYTSAAELTDDSVSLEVIAKQLIYGNYYEGEKIGQYTVSKIFTNSSGLNATGLTRTVKGEQESILVFRGTSDILDVLADITKDGVGYDQYYNVTTRQEILDWATEAASQGTLSITGHSLGGTLAQWFAADFTSRSGRLDKVETFNATGISKKDAEKFVAGNCQVIHHLVSGDAVSMFGEAFID